MGARWPRSPYQIDRKAVATIGNKHLMVIAVAACVLALSGIGSQKKPVERLVKGIALATAVITRGAEAPLSIVSDGEGRFSHAGPYTTLAIGVPDAFAPGGFLIKGLCKN